MIKAKNQLETINYRKVCYKCHFKKSCDDVVIIYSELFYSGRNIVLLVFCLFIYDMCHSPFDKASYDVENILLLFLAFTIFGTNLMAFKFFFLLRYLSKFPCFSFGLTFTNIDSRLFLFHAFHNVFLVFESNVTNFYFPVD